MELSDLPKYIVDIGKQVRFATARTLTIVATETQQWLTTVWLPSKIRLRTAWWKPGRKYGVNRTLSWTGKAPSDGDMSATVASRAPWLVENERGATKKPKGKWLLIPNVGSKARPTIDRVVQNQWRPTKGKDQGGEQGIFFKKTKEGLAVFTKLGKKAKLQLLFFLATKAKVKPRTEFEKEGAKHAAQQMDKVYDEQLKKALESAKP